MKKILIALISLVLATPIFAAELQRYQPGPRLIDGTQLNTIVDALNSALECHSYVQKVAAASLVDETFFIANRPFKVRSVSAVFSVTNGAALTVQLSKDTGTNAPGAGTDLLTTALDLNTTANTVLTGVLVGTAGVTSLATGNRLAVDFSAAGTNIVGFVLTVCMAPN